MTDVAYVEKLRRYFDGLSPETRTRLLSELEVAMLRDVQLPDAEVIKAELTRGLRGTSTRVKRLGNPSRVFFDVLEPYLVDDAPDALRRGEVARRSIAPIWGWICREVAPKAAHNYCELVKRALLADDRRAIQGLVLAFQEQALGCIDRMIATRGSDQIRERLSVYMGGGRCYDDLCEIRCILKGRARLEALASTLPAKMTELDDEALAKAKSALDGLADANGELVLYGLIIVMRRLAQPWQLIRLAFHQAEREAQSRFVKTPYGMGVGLVLRTSEDMAANLTAAFRDGEITAASQALSNLKLALTELNKLEVPVTSVWAKRLAALRAQLKSLEEIEARSISSFMPDSRRRSLPVTGDRRELPLGLGGPGPRSAEPARRQHAAVRSPVRH